VTVTGSVLGPAQLVSASPDAIGLYPTQLAGTSVQIAGVAAPLLYTSATEISAVVPFEVTGASSGVTVTYQGQTSALATVVTFPSALALFTADGSGLGQAAAINQDGTINTPSNPAPAGSIISLFATGGGQTTPGSVDGQVSSAGQGVLNLPLSALIGPNSVLQTSQFPYVGAAPGEIAGILQINTQISPYIQPGSAVSVLLSDSQSDRPSQSGVTIAVSAANK
jgi:uncharacterized protein (TIGR03437 family)